MEDKGKKRSNFSRIKPKSRSGKFERLRSLKCFDLILSRIREGWQLAPLARWIQNEMEEYTEVSHQGLTRLLGEFRSSLPPGELVNQRMPSAMLAARDKIEEGVDEIQELEELYRLQMKRINIDFGMEEKINKLIPSMTGEIREARHLLESIFNAKSELGLRTRVPARQEVGVDVNVEVEGKLESDLGAKFSSEAVKQVLDNAESRRRVLGTVERLLRASNAPSPMAKSVGKEASDGD